MTPHSSSSSDRDGGRRPARRRGAGRGRREGQKVAAPLGAANRDPAVSTSRTFDVDRDPNNHLAFGVGVHFCLGAPLARMELAESVGALFETFPDLHLAGEPVSRGPSCCGGTAASL